jgi:hypothetical protein
MEGIERMRKVKSKMTKKNKNRRDMMKCRDSCKCNFKRDLLIIQSVASSSRTMKMML